MSSVVPCCPECLGALMPGQQGACPHCGRELPAPESQYTRKPGSYPCRCLVLGVQPREPAHHACPAHGDLEQLAAAERSVLAALAAQPQP